MQQNATPVDLSLLWAQIDALEAELSRYAFKYGITNEARRLLAARLSGGEASTSDS